MEFLYAEPAVRRQADADAEAQGLPAPSRLRQKGDYHFDADELPDKAAFVRGMMQIQAGTAAEWAARWDDMAAAKAAEGAA